MSLKRATINQSVYSDINNIAHTNRKRNTKPSELTIRIKHSINKEKSVPTTLSLRPSASLTHHLSRVKFAVFGLRPRVDDNVPSLQESANPVSVWCLTWRSHPRKKGRKNGLLTQRQSFNENIAWQWWLKHLGQMQSNQNIYICCMTSQPFTKSHISWVILSSVSFWW